MLDLLLNVAKDPQTILWAIALVIGYIWYRRSIRVAAMRFEARTISLLDSNTRSMFSELEMNFKGRPVQSLKRTWIVVWNRGTAAVRRQEFAEHDPLRIVCKNGELLRCVVKKRTNPANNFTLPEYLPGAESLTPEFEYFDPNDGVQLEIWHTGDGSKIVAEGSIIDAGKVLETIANAETPAYRKIPAPETVHWGHVAFVVAFACLMLWAIGGGGFEHLLEKIEHGSPTYKLIDQTFNVIGYVFGGIVILFFVVLIAAMITATSMRVPKALAIDFQESTHLL